MSYMYGREIPWEYIDEQMQVAAMIDKLPNSSKEFKIVAAWTKRIFFQSFYNLASQKGLEQNQNIKRRSNKMVTLPLRYIRYIHETPKVEISKGPSQGKHKRRLMKKNKSLKHELTRNIYKIKTTDPFLDKHITIKNNITNDSGFMCAENLAYFIDMESAHC